MWLKKSITFDIFRITNKYTLLTCSAKWHPQRSTVTPCFPQFVINHRIGITMLMHEDNVNVLLFELPITECWGEALKVLAMISLEEECENYTRGFICQITPKSPLIRMTSLLRIPRKENQSMKKGPMVESPTTP
jgi:hypothetical protein